MSSPASAVPDVPMHVRVDQTVPVIVIPDHLGFDDLRAWVRDQMPAQLDLIGGRASRLDLGARELKLFDLRRLIHLLREDFGVEITGLYVAPESVHRYAERELKLKLFFLEEAVDAPDEIETEIQGGDDESVDEAALEAPEPGLSTEAPDAEEATEADDDLPDAEKIAATTLPNDLDALLPREVKASPAPAQTRSAQPREEPGSRTMAVHRNLRGGSSLRFDGDIIVYGDVNPGAQVVATGNITVLGALKGMAHAGATGDEEAFIFALLLRPTQLRIARKIAVPPDRTRDLVPEQARVEGEQIVIETFAPRLRG